MKTKFLTLIAMGTATAIGQAFTIDFNALDVPFGTTVDSATPLTVAVAGYGDVRFDVPAGTVLEVAKHFSNDGGTTFQNSLELDPAEVVLVTFLGPTALNVDFDIIGVSSGENTAGVQFSSTEYQYSPGGGDGTGIAAISWNTIPEPSSSLLVLVGAGALILRRRKG